MRVALEGYGYQARKPANRPAFLRASVAEPTQSTYIVLLVFALSLGWG